MCMEIILILCYQHCLVEALQSFQHVICPAVMYLVSGKDGGNFDLQWVIASDITVSLDITVSPDSFKLGHLLWFCLLISLLGTMLGWQFELNFMETG